jgi:hypothetical protein
MMTVMIACAIDGTKLVYPSGSKIYPGSARRDKNGMSKYECSVGLMTPVIFKNATITIIAPNRHGKQIKKL